VEQSLELAASQVDIGKSCGERLSASERVCDVERHAVELDGGRLCCRDYPQANLKEVSSTGAS
jgi:hypothetical protein